MQGLFPQLKISSSNILIPIDHFTGNFSKFHHGKVMGNFPFIGKTLGQEIPFWGKFWEFLIPRIS